MTFYSVNSFSVVVWWWRFFIRVYSPSKEIKLEDPRVWWLVSVIGHRNKDFDLYSSQRVGKSWALAHNNKL